MAPLAFETRAGPLPPCGAGPVPPRAGGLPVAPASGGYPPAEAELPPTVPVLPARDSRPPAPLPAGPLQPPFSLGTNAGVGISAVESPPASGGEAEQYGTEILDGTDAGPATDFSLVTAPAPAQHFFIGTGQSLHASLASGSCSGAGEAQAEDEDEVCTLPAGSGDLQEVFSVIGPSPLPTGFEVVDSSPLPTNFVDVTHDA